MTRFSLHPQLAKDCHELGKLELCHILLMDNALVPWFILVPETSITEFHQLEHKQQLQLLEEINRISGFIESHFTISKLNTATIGNIVRQMHIHIIGRHEKDYCWPGVVWGRVEKEPYEQSKVDEIRNALKHWFLKHQYSLFTQ